MEKKKKKQYSFTHIYFQTHSPVVRTTSSRGVTRLAPITGKKIRRRLDVKQRKLFPLRAKIEEERRLYDVRDVCNKCTTRKKNIGKANQKNKTKKFLLLHLSFVHFKKQAIFSREKEASFSCKEENKQHAIILSTTHTKTTTTTTTITTTTTTL